MLGVFLELVQRAERVCEAELGFSNVAEILLGAHVQALEDRR